MHGCWKIHEKIQMVVGLKGICKLFCCKTLHKEYEGASPLAGNEDGEVNTGEVWLYRYGCCIHIQILMEKQM